MRIRYAAKTDVGLKRTLNEDYFALVEEEQLFMVADGMGGHSSGEVASQLAAEVLGEFYRHSRDEDATWPFRYDPNMTYPENRMVAGIRMANSRIHRTAQKTPQLRGMGTTIVTAMVEGGHAYIGHVGDSRCYRIRDGKIEQLTRDHSLLEDYKDARPEMTEEEAENFPHKNVITRALGMRDAVQVDVGKHELLVGDRYLLCSDGLSGMLSDDSMLDIMETGMPLEKTVATLIDKANAAGGTDNITALIFECV